MRRSLIKTNHATFCPLLPISLLKNNKDMEQNIKQTLLDSIGTVYEKSENCKLEADFYSKVEAELAIISDYFKVSQKQAFIIANIGCMGTKFSIELAKHAEETGVDAISSFPPIYYKFSFDEIKEYYFDIADSVNVPLIIYYIPSFTNVEMSLENFSELLEHKNIMGVKFTSMNLFMLERIKALSNKTIFNGFDEVFLGGLSLGADGMIGSTCNIVPAIIRAIYDSFRSKEMEKAYIYQQKLNEIINDIKDFGIIPATKVILSLIGIECGKPRKPFKALEEEEIARLSSLMKSWDIDFRL